MYRVFLGRTYRGILGCTIKRQKDVLFFFHGVCIGHVLAVCIGWIKRVCVCMCVCVCVCECECVCVCVCRALLR